LAYPRTHSLSTIAYVRTTVAVWQSRARKPSYLLGVYSRLHYVRVKVCKL